MAYVRKTRDEIRMMINYGQGWEHETIEESYAAAKAQRKVYAENCPQYPTRIVSVRVPLEITSARKLSCGTCGVTLQLSGKATQREIDWMERHNGHKVSEVRS